jgi:hypothetical protein
MLEMVGYVIFMIKLSFSEIAEYPAIVPDTRLFFFGEKWK